MGAESGKRSNVWLPAPNAHHPRHQAVSHVSHLSSRRHARSLTPPSRALPGLLRGEANYTMCSYSYLYYTNPIANAKRFSSDPGLKVRHLRKHGQH